MRRCGPCSLLVAALMLAPLPLVVLGPISCGGKVEVDPRSVEGYCARLEAILHPWCDYYARCCTEGDRADEDIDGMMVFCPSSKFEANCIDEVDTYLRFPGFVWDSSAVDGCLTEKQALLAPPPATCSGLGVARQLAHQHANDSIGQPESCKRLIHGPKVAGEACSIVIGSECLPGLSCRFDTIASDAKCQPRSDEGEACTLTLECLSGLVCVGDIFSGSHCRRALLADGSACVSDEDCEEDSVCVFETEPEPKHHCVRRTGDGPCKSASQCSLGHACNYSAHLCQSLGADGAPCTKTAECLGRCDPATHTCTSVCGGAIY